MAEKTFINTTDYELVVDLTVRRGETPGQAGRPVNFKMLPHTESQIPYGENKDPYLDGILVKATWDGSMIAATAQTTTRGSRVDRAMNMNDHVIVATAQDSLVLNFQNG